MKALADASAFFVDMNGLDDIYFNDAFALQI